MLESIISERFVFLSFNLQTDVGLNSMIELGFHSSGR